MNNDKKLDLLFVTINKLPATITSSRRHPFAQARTGLRAVILDVHHHRIGGTESGGEGFHENIRAVPGQVGNAVFAAHSSNDIFAPGDYGVVFAQNEKLVAGDIIYMNYESKRYTYSVTSTEVVLPTEVSKVQIQTDKPMLTLISCVPIGTAQKRLLVFAEQVSPDPAKAEAAASTDTSPTSTTIPGRPAPSLLERLFGAN